LLYEMNTHSIHTYIHGFTGDINKFSQYVLGHTAGILGVCDPGMNQ